MTTAPVYVTKSKSGNLLSYMTSVDLQVIPEIHSLESSKADELCKKYSHVFTGIGKMINTKIDLHVDPSVQPVTQPHRRIPFILENKLKLN